MYTSPSTFELLAETTKRGLIYVNEAGIVEIYSTLAKEITGVILTDNKTHPRR